MFKSKNFRYYYWLVIEFLKKHFKIIFFSFLSTLILILSLFSVYPYLSDFVVTKKIIIGIAGKYNFNNLPEEIYKKISNGLIYVDENGKVLPALISSWEKSNNNLEYHFQLRRDLYWNDGKKFNAKDINYSFKDVEVEVADQYLIKFKLKKPLAIFPLYLNKPIIKSPLIGVAGLYKVNKYVTKGGRIKEISLYPNKKGLEPIVYKFYDNESQLINAYKLAEINQMQTDKINLADIFAKWPNTKVEKNYDYSRLLTLFINFNNPLFKSRDLRQAITLSINKNKLGKYGLLASGPIPPNSWAYNPDIKKYNFDPELAKKIFEKNISASDSAKINFVTFYEYLDVANEIYNDLVNVGIKANFNMVSYGQNLQFDLLLAYFKVPDDPDQYFYWHSTQEKGNIANYKNLKVDKLLEDGRNLLFADDRKEKYDEFQKAIVDDIAAVFIYFPNIYTIKRK
ncbi:MAG: ABC transporter substrate-binding protein [Microgenomates group bacterium]|nr:ABC transporter substrate-binding protein [Microgenomates group bacterium]